MHLNNNSLRKFYLSWILFFSFLDVSFGQYEEIVDYKIQLSEGMTSAPEGTYQILIDPKYNPVFTSELAYFVESNRKKNEDVWIKLMPCAELYIPSKNKINSIDFQPLKIYSY